MPRFTLAGNNLAAAFVLDLLLDAGTAEDVLVIAPEPSGRPSWQVSLAAHAEARGVACLTPEDVNEEDAVERVRSHDPDLFLSVYYTQLFRGELLDAIAGKALNFHPSLLPLHRGHAPLIWSIVEGDRSTGLSVHHIDRGIDTGNLVVQRPLPIHDQDTGYVLHRKMANLVRATAGGIIRDFVAGKPLSPGQPQTGASSYHTSRDPQVNHIVWSDPRERVRNVVRALAPPLPGAFVLARGTPLVLTRVEPVPSPSLSTKPPGMVEVESTNTPVVWAADGPLRLSTVLVDGAVVPGSALVESGRLTEGEILD